MVEMVQLLRGLCEPLSTSKHIKNGTDRQLANPNIRVFKANFLEKEGTTPMGEEQPNQGDEMTLSTLSKLVVLVILCSFYKLVV